MPTYAPQNPFPEKPAYTFERTMAPSIPGNRGPLRFEEGVATETDVSNDFAQGAYGDPAPDSRGHSRAEMFYKHADQTMRERAHIGSAAWVDAPEVLSDFVQGSQAGDSRPSFEYAYNSGGYQARTSPARVG